MSRRDFIKNSSLLAGGAILQPPFSALFKPDEKIFKVGIIGCGDRGKGLLQVLQSLPEHFKVIAICDVLDFRFQETRKIITGVKEFKDYHELLSDKEVDVAVVATPLNLHYKIAVDVLEAGKHLFLEKTMTYNIPQALDLVKKVKQYPKQVVQVGHQYRYVPLYFKVKEMISKGYLGKVTQIDCRWDRNANWRRPVPDPKLERQINWRMYKAYSGGLVAELLSHQMDFINWAFDTHPDEVFGTGGIDNFKDGRETYDNVQVMLRYNNEGMIGNFGATCSNAREGYIFKIKGTKGTVSLLTNDGVYYPESQTKKELETVDGVTGATKIEWNKEGGIPIIKEKMKDGTWYAFEDFYDCLINGKTPASNILTGARTAICVHMANSAMYTHSIQSWRPAYDMGQVKMING
ncbi:MAG TPA: Gfo/Idh/MocA family oxidoreductase [Flavitalea sp.]|nr:Gfo/Idh/MocA family oxidoreductase [Flavitalea sp.]